MKARGESALSGLCTLLMLFVGLALYRLREEAMLTS